MYYVLGSNSLSFLFNRLWYDFAHPGPHLTFKMPNNNMVFTNIIFLFFYIYFVFPNVCVSSWCVTSHLFRELHLSENHGYSQRSELGCERFWGHCSKNALEEWIFPSNIRFCYRYFHLLFFTPMHVYQQNSQNLFSYFTTLRISMTLITYNM